MMNFKKFEEPETVVLLIGKIWTGCEKKFICFCKSNPSSFKVLPFFLSFSSEMMVSH
jgi:hypothetical protein